MTDGRHLPNLSTIFLIKKYPARKLHNCIVAIMMSIIASWDHEAQRLFQFLKESGLTENSYIIVTADHGELFERGELGHWTKMIYDPIIHVPLIVRSPGQEFRQDVHTITSSVDLLPTVAHLTGNPIPELGRRKPPAQSGWGSGRWPERVLHGCKIEFILLSFA